MIQAVEKYLYYAFRRASLHCSHHRVGPGHPFKICFRAERLPPGRCRAATPGPSPQQQLRQEQRLLWRVLPQRFWAQRLLQQQLPQPRSQGAGRRRLRRLSPRHDGSSAGRGRRDLTQPILSPRKTSSRARFSMRAGGPAGRFADEVVDRVAAVRRRESGRFRAPACGAPARARPTHGGGQRAPGRGTGVP